jgi:hypothetical protein
MRLFVKAAAGLVTAAIMLGAPILSTAEAGTTARHGCAAYHFCIYPQNAGWNHDHPSPGLSFDGAFPGGLDHYWRNLSGQIGTHKVFNNGYCIKVVLNEGYNGGGAHRPPILDGRSYDWDLTPINSITVWADFRPDCLE